MKIGILTFHCAHNYGAVLQAYALSKYLASTGNDVEIINYRPASITRAHGVFPLGIFCKEGIKGKIRFLLNNIPYIIHRFVRSYKFNRFIKTLQLSKKTYTERDEYISGYDVIICGSDQIWNPSITNGQDPFYTHKVGGACAFVSYAASAELKPAYYNVFKEIVNRFCKISVRESAFKNILDEIIPGKQIYRVLDPVFLLSKKDWQSLAEKSTIKNKYILIYQVRRDNRVIRLAEDYAVNKGLSVIEITAEANFLYKNGRYRTATPTQFVGLFANAECVLTTSFHGTSFAAIFNKPCKTVLFGSPGDIRALDLIETIGIKNGTINITDKSLDYCNYVAPNRLDEEIRLSKEYLNLVLDEEGRINQ